MANKLSAQEKKKAHGLALLEAGIPPETVAEILKVTERTLQRWRKDAKDKGLDLTHVVAKSVAEKKESEFLEALEGYMHQAFVTFTKHLEYASDESYFKKQDPDKIATFDGIHADKVFRVLDAIAEHQRNAIDESDE